MVTHPKTERYVLLLIVYELWLMFMFMILVVYTNNAAIVYYTD